MSRKLFGPNSHRNLYPLYCYSRVTLIPPEVENPGIPCLPRGKRLVLVSNYRVQGSSIDSTPLLSGLDLSMSEHVEVSQDGKIHKKLISFRSKPLILRRKQCVCVCLVRHEASVSSLGFIKVFSFFF